MREHHPQEVAKLRAAGSYGDLTVSTCCGWFFEHSRAPGAVSRSTRFDRFHAEVADLEIDVEPVGNFAARGQVESRRQLR